MIGQRPKLRWNLRITYTAAHGGASLMSYLYTSKSAARRAYAKLERGLQKSGGRVEIAGLFKLRPGRYQPGPAPR